VIRQDNATSLNDVNVPLAQYGDKQFQLPQKRKKVRDEMSRLGLRGTGENRTQCFNQKNENIDVWRPGRLFQGFVLCLGDK